MTEQLKLYGYWRSSAAYRGRIALNLKGLEYEYMPVDLIRDGGDQLRPGYESTHPQRLIPVLQHGHRMGHALIEAAGPACVERDRAHIEAPSLTNSCAGPFASASAVPAGLANSGRLSAASPW